MTKSSGVGRGGPRPGFHGKPHPKVPKVEIAPVAVADPAVTASDLAKRHVAEAIETLAIIAAGGASEMARVAAAKALIEHAYGKPGAPDQIGKKEQRNQKAQGVAVGKLATPAPPKLTGNNGVH